MSSNDWRYFVAGSGGLRWQKFAYPIAVRVIVTAIIQTLDSLHLKYPEAGPDKLEELAAARAPLVK